MPNTHNATTNFVLKPAAAGKIRLFAASWLFCACAAAASQETLKCAPGWKAEIIAESPRISAPSVICCSPDGRLFMGEDPDDMGSPSDATADSVLSIYPNGQMLTFASNLHAVFGLQYMDGKLYVHHTPEFSIFDDFHGMGVNRVDLITNDNPHPWAPSFNDHIPSGFHLAMDGYFYFTTGDKGILGAVGADGRKIEMRGGVYRMRPDGTGLEVYCTGTRNHLNVAINPEDEMFTFDNTDDGGGWWERVTHMVDGGYYGYPYDFKPRRPYTLWCMADYAGGAPTDVCCYNEDALPDEYKGNLFMCDWSGSRVYRLPVRRDGATYKIVETLPYNDTNAIGARDSVKLTHEFLGKGDMDDFRPVGICVSPDGKSFYITDWGHSYWKRDEKMGRLFKVTYTGKTQESPKPAWYLPAAAGEKFDATTQELIRGLMHPAESVRLVAQRRLAERGRAAGRQVLKLLKDRKAPSYARWFAIWTLDAMDAGKHERHAIIAALKDKDVTVQMQAARELGTRSVRQARDPLTALLHATNAALRFRASTALGRIGDRAAVPALMKELDQKDLFARYAAFFALRRIGLADPKAWPEIVDGLANTNAAIREGVMFAMRETYDPALARALAAFSARQNVPLAVRSNVFTLLSGLFQKQPPWNGDWWNTTPVNSPPAPKSVNWDGTPIVASALRAAIKDSEVSIRKMGIEWAHASHDTNIAAELAELFQRETDTSARADILRDLAAMPGKTGNAIITSVLQNPRAPMELLLAAIESAGKIEGSQWNADLIAMAGQTREERVQNALFDFFGRKKLVATIPLLTANLAKSSPDLRQHIVDALKEIGGQAAIEGLMTNLDSPDKSLQRQIISALGSMKAKSALPALMKIAPSSEVYDAAVEALSQMPDVAALNTYLDGLGSKNTSLRTQCEKAMRAIQKQALPLIEARLAANDLDSLAYASLKQIYQNDPAAKKCPFFHHKILETPPTQYQQYAIAHVGDSRRGKKLFHDLKGLGCIRCHRISGEGGDIGPDLTGIHAKYPRSFIIESVIYPSKQILDGYQQVLFETRDDEDVSGIVRSENAEEVTLVDSSGATNVLKKSNITSRKVSQISLMPEGLQSGLSLAEFSDLISYVENPAPTQAPKPQQFAGRPQPPPSPIAVAPEPEPGADLFSFLDFPPEPEEPVHAAPAAYDPPPMPLPPEPEADDDSSASQSIHEWPPMPPGWKPPPSPPRN